MDKLLRIQHSVRSHFVPKTISILSTKNNGSKVYRFFCNKESLRWFFKANESNTHDKFNLNGLRQKRTGVLILIFWILCSFYFESNCTCLTCIYISVIHLWINYSNNIVYTLMYKIKGVKVPLVLSVPR